MHDIFDHYNGHVILFAEAVHPVFIEAHVDRRILNTAAPYVLWEKFLKLLPCADAGNSSLVKSLIGLDVFYQTFLF